MGGVGAPVSSTRVGEYGEMSAGSDRVNECLQAGQKWSPYRGRTQVPAYPGVGREVVQDEVTQGIVEVLAYIGVEGLEP